MPQLDLNADAGESFGVWHLGQDEALLPHLSSVNLPCGFHAADALTMQRSVTLALTHGVAIGAHPGFRDLAGFGRRDLAVSPAELYAEVLYQLGALDALVRAQGGTLHHVKAHGALYLKMLHDPLTAQAVIAAVATFDAALPLIVLAGPAGAAVATQAARAGLRVVLEAFPDRAYLEDGRLAPRTVAGAVLHEPEAIAARALQMAQAGTVTTLAGTSLRLHAQTLCLHGDTPRAAVAARAVREALSAAGVTIGAF